MHYKLNFIFKLTNVTNWNCYVISVILLKCDKDVTVQYDCPLHALYSEITWIKSATMYEFGLFGSIISHCNAMSKCECSISDVLFNIAKVQLCCILLCVLQKYKSNSTLHKLVTYSFLFYVNICSIFILLI
jgi:hypothetical protein